MDYLSLYLFLAVCVLLMLGYPVAFTLAGTALAFAAAGAGKAGDFRNKIGCMNRIQNRKAPGSNHGFTAAAATIADKIHPLPHIFAELNKIVLISLVQEFLAFPGLKHAGMTIFNQ